MLITQALPRPASRPAGNVTTENADQAPVETFDRPSEALVTLYSRDAEARTTGIKIAKSVGGGLLGGALGVYAGTHTGLPAGIAGAAALVIPGAMVGAIGAGVLAERYGSSGSDTAGAAIAGGVLGGLASVAAGAYLGSQVIGPAAAIGLGLAGAAAGAYFAFS